MLDPARALADAWVDSRLWESHPDYVALLIVADGLAGRPSGSQSEDALQQAETVTAQRLNDRPADDLPDVAVWRAAFASFGVKPRVARSSVEALLRRCSDGLPRIDPLTDLYNAVSVAHLVPIGGEDLDGYDGPPRLVVADGSEEFDTIADGQPITQHAAAGEIIWRRHRRDLPAVELAAMHPHPAQPSDDPSLVYSRRFRRARHRARHCGGG